MGISDNGQEFEINKNIIMMNKFNCYLLYNVLSEDIIELDAEAFSLVNRITKYDTISLDKLYRIMSDEIISDTNYSAIINIFRDAEILIAKRNDSIIQLPLFEQYRNVYENKMNNLSGLSLHVSHSCQYACTYCYANQGTYGKRNMMSKDIATSAIDFLFGNTINEILEIAFFGGEPLLNFDVINNTVQYALKKAEEFDKTIRFTITTNGDTNLLDDEVIELFNQNKFIVVISLDGDFSANEGRILKNGMPTFYRTVKGIKKIKQKINGLVPRLKATISVEEIDNLEHNLTFLYNLFPEAEISFTPLNNMRMNDLNKFLTVKDNFYHKLVLDYFKNKNKSTKEMVKQIFHIDLDSQVNIVKRVSFSSCASISSMPSLTPSGELYACHRRANDSIWYLGDLKQGIDENKIEYFDKKSISMVECQDCNLVAYCNGGCAESAYNKNLTIYQPNPHTCSLVRSNVSNLIWLDYIKNSMN